MPSESRQEAVRVGIAGLGRSGWNIHAATIAALPDRFRLIGAFDALPRRRQEARDKFGCAGYESLEALMDNSDIELVVIATPNHLHAEQTMAALAAGKHVVCEKPFAVSAPEADRVIATAEGCGRTLAVYHNRRFDPHYQKVREVVESGVLGRIVQVRFGMHHFSRRWDWQTLKEFGGGELANAGAHFLDQLLWFFPDQLPEVFCYTDRALTLGDAEDHCVVMMRSAEAPLVQMEISSVCGYPQDNWLIMGTRGSLRGTFEQLQWRVVRFDQLPERGLEREPMADRSYNFETVPWEEHQWKVPAEQVGAQFTHRRFYGALFETLRNGAPLIVTPSEVRRQMLVLDACRSQT